MPEVLDAPVVEKTPEKPKPKKQPPYTVIIINDDHHTFDYVVEVMQKVFKLDRQTAGRYTLRVHNEGRCAVWTGTKELAELKVEQVKNFGDDPYASVTPKYSLGCTMEPVA